MFAPFERDFSPKTVHFEQMLIGKLYFRLAAGENFGIFRNKNDFPIDLHESERKFPGIHDFFCDDSNKNSSNAN